MADLNNKKTVEEDDPIKKMLEKLRQSVAAPVAETLEEAPSAAEENKEKRKKNGGRKEQPLPAHEEEEPTPPVDIFESGLVQEILPDEPPVASTMPEPPIEEADAPQSEEPTVVAENEEEDALFFEEPTKTDEIFDQELDEESENDFLEIPDEEMDEEDSVDDAVIAQFFKSAEEDVPVTDEAPIEETFAEAPLAQEESADEETPVFETEEEDDGLEYDVVSFEDVSSIDETEEEKEQFTPASVSKEFVGFLKESEGETLGAVEIIEAEEASEVDEPIELLLDEDEVSKSEADLLFRPTPTQMAFSAKEEASPWDLEEDASSTVEHPPVVPNEDNGYAVEVEVRQDIDAWYAPSAAQVKAEPARPVAEEIEQTPLAEEKETDLPIGEVTPTTPVAAKPAEPSVEDLLVDDIDDFDGPVAISYGEEDTFSAKEFANAPIEPKTEKTAQKAETDEEEGRSYTSFTQPLTMPMPKLADGEKMPARKVLASFFGRKGGAGTGRKKVWREKKKAVTPDALAGIYNEAGADYHEYTSRNQITLFSERFVADITSCTVRVFILAFLCTLLLLLENLGRLGVVLGGFFAQPGGLAATHLILMVLVLLCCVPMFTYAWRHLFANRVLPEAYLAICLLLSFFYDVYLLLAMVPSPYLFGMVPAVSALILSVVDRLKIKGDYTSFKLVSSSGDKLACTVSCGAQTAEEAAAIADLEEGKDTRVLFVKKVGFTSGFFHRVSRVCEDGRKNLWLLITALVASMMAAIVVGVLQHSLSAGLYAFCVTLSFSFPTCTLLLHKLPVAQLFARAAANRSAVVGEVSALEYCDAAANAFEDVEAFPSRNVRVQRIKLYGNSALDRVLYQMAGVFSTVGGPLDGVFRSSTAEIGLPSHVRLLRVEEGGLAVMVDGREICVGRGEYMLRRHIHVYYDPEDESILANGKTNVMYAAENGHLIAKFYIRYKMDEDFEKDVEQLHKRGIRAILRTYDPNISEDLIAAISYTANFGIRVVKKTEEQQKDFAVARLNSGIVTKAATRNILRTLFACRRMCRLTAILEAASMFVACGGMLFAVFMSIFGGVFAVPSFFFALYQLLVVGAVALTGKLYI